MIVAVSAAMRRAVSLVERFAATPLPVLLVGPTGSGKELLARRIHELSGRNGRLVDLNCAALPRDLAESELFGHRRGAYTGAHVASEGLVSAANRGSLFLDEITSLPFELQGKFLRVLENREVRRVGDTSSRVVDFRLVAAAHPEIAAAVGAGTFRADLFHRIAGIRIEIPPLLERPEDLLPMAEGFANLARSRLSKAAAAIIVRHAWPGNGRELKAAVERASVLSETADIPASTMAEAIDLGSDGADGSVRGRQSPVACVPPHAAWLMDICAANGWNANRIAASLGIHRSTLFRWLRHFGVTLKWQGERRPMKRPAPDVSQGADHLTGSVDSAPAGGGRLHRAGSARPR